LNPADSGDRVGVGFGLGSGSRANGFLIISRVDDGNEERDRTIDG
jgi:hypothetical protein